MVSSYFFAIVCLHLLGTKGRFNKRRGKSESLHKECL